MKSFTLGFIFTPDFSQVLLMHKNRPDWQKGKLNGVGGKIEKGEKSADCITREVLEEAGVATKKRNWKRFGKIEGNAWRVDLYALVYEGKMEDFSTVTDEAIEWVKTDALPDTVHPNLHWMIPMGVHSLQDRNYRGCVVEYVQ